MGRLIGDTFCQPSPLHSCLLYFISCCFRRMKRQRCWHRSSLAGSMTLAVPAAATDFAVARTCNMLAHGAWAPLV